jgi:hypothetical protein
MPFGGSIRSCNLSISHKLGETIESAWTRLETAADYDVQVGSRIQVDVVSAALRADVEAEIVGHRGIRNTPLYPVAFDKFRQVNPFRLGAHLQLMQRWLEGTSNRPFGLPEATNQNKNACKSLLARISLWYAIQMYQAGSSQELSELVALSRLSFACSD